MDGKGRYLDNIFVERLWRSIKYEEVYLKAYQTVAEARAGIDAYRTTSRGLTRLWATGSRGIPKFQVADSGMVKPSVGVGDSLNLALGLS